MELPIYTAPWLLFDSNRALAGKDRLFVQKATRRQAGRQADRQIDCFVFPSNDFVSIHWLLVWRGMFASSFVGVLKLFGPSFYEAVCCVVSSSKWVP